MNCSTYKNSIIKKQTVEYLNVLDPVCKCPMWFYLFIKTKLTCTKTCNITGSDCMTSWCYCGDSLKTSSSMLHILQSSRDLLLRRAVPLRSLQDARSFLLPPSDLTWPWLRSQDANPATARCLHLASEGQRLWRERRGKNDPFWQQPASRSD